MARYRVRGFLPDRTPVIIIVDRATDAYDAVVQARAEIVAEGQEHLLPRIDQLGATEMDESKAKSKVYIGKTPSTNGKRGRPAQTPTPTPTPTQGAQAETAQKGKKVTV